MRFIIYKNFEILFQGEFDGESFVFNEIKKSYLKYALSQNSQKIFKFVRIFKNKKFETKIQNGKFLKGFLK